MSQRWPEFVAPVAGLLIGFLILHGPAPGDGAESATANKSAKRDKGSSSFSSPGWTVREDVALQDLEDYVPESGRRFAEGVVAISQSTTEELASFWQVLLAEEPTDNILRILVMLRWLELAPTQAMKVATESSYESQAWNMWGRVDPNSALAAAEKAGRSQLRAVVIEIAGDDPRRAMKLLERFPDLEVKRAIHRGLAKHEGYEVALEYDFQINSLGLWASSHPRDAINWATDHQDLLKKPRDWERLANHLYEADPTYLDEVIARLPPDNDARRALESHLISNLAQSDPERAIALREEGAHSRYVLASIGKTIAPNHPERSLALFRDLHDENPLHAAQAGDWIRELIAHGDPAALANIAAESNSRALPRIADRWMWQDRSGFGEWAASRPAEERDQHYRQLTEATLESNMELHHPDIYHEAMSWAGRVQNEETRQTAIRYAVLSWRENQPESAEQSYQSGGWNAEVRAIYEQLSENPER